MVKKACVNNSSSYLPPITLPAMRCMYINTCNECSKLRAYLSYGHWPVPRCPDKGRLTVHPSMFPATCCGKLSSALFLATCCQLVAPLQHCNIQQHFTTTCCSNKCCLVYNGLNKRKGSHMFIWTHDSGHDWIIIHTHSLTSLVRYCTFIRVLTSAPLSINNSTTTARPSLEATISAVAPFCRYTHMWRE